jgi:hypothetical protein
MNEMSSSSHREILGLSIEQMRMDREILQEQEKLKHEELIAEQNERLLISKILKDYDDNRKLALRTYKINIAILILAIISILIVVLR